MKTVPFNKAEALAGRKVQHGFFENSPLGHVIAVDGKLAWVRWQEHSSLHETANLYHLDLTPDPTPRPVDLLALNWPSIWVRAKGESGYAWFVRDINKECFRCGDQYGRVYLTQYVDYEMAPSPSGPWRPMVE